MAHQLLSTRSLLRRLKVVHLLRKVLIVMERLALQSQKDNATLTLLQLSQHHTMWMEVTLSTLKYWL